MIAVVLGAPSNKERFNDAMALLSYGYSVSRLYEDSNQDTLPNLPERWCTGYLRLAYGDTFRLWMWRKWFVFDWKRTGLGTEVVAPIEEGQAVGEMVYNWRYQNRHVFHSGCTGIPKATYLDCILRLVTDVFGWFDSFLHLYARWVRLR